MQSAGVHIVLNSFTGAVGDLSQRKGYWRSRHRHRTAAESKRGERKKKSRPRKKEERTSGVVEKMSSRRRHREGEKDLFEPTGFHTSKKRVS